MKVICNATVPNDKQLLNLCECIKIIGADYYLKGDKVYAEYIGDQESAELLADLFRHYPLHGVSTLS